MDRVLSARVDEAVLSTIGVLANELQTTKKQVIEGAINLYAEKVRREQGIDVFDHTSGAWKRSETAATTASRARKAFRDSMTRRHR